MSVASELDESDAAILARAQAHATERIKPLTEQAENGGRQITHQSTLSQPSPLSSCALT